MCESCMSNTSSHVLSPNFICLETIIHVNKQFDKETTGIAERKLWITLLFITTVCNYISMTFSWVKKSLLQTWAFINPLKYLASRCLHFPNTFSIFLGAWGIFFTWLPGALNNFGHFQMQRSSFNFHFIIQI